MRELTFFIGSKRSCLDAYVFPMLGWGGEMLPGGLAFLANIRAHHDRKVAEPAVRRVFAAEGLEYSLPEIYHCEKSLC